MKEKDSRLISQCVKLLHRCLYTMLSHLFFGLFLSSIPSLSLLLSSLAPSPPFLSLVSLTPQPLYSCINPILSLSTSLCPIPHDLPSSTKCPVFFKYFIFTHVLSTSIPMTLSLQAELLLLDGTSAQWRRTLLSLH